MFGLICLEDIDNSIEISILIDLQSSPVANVLPFCKLVDDEKIDGGTTVDKVACVTVGEFPTPLDCKVIPP